MNAIKTFYKRHRKELLITVAAILVLLLIVCVVVLIEDYSTGLDRQAEDAARMYTMTYGTALHDAVDHFADRAVLLAAQIPDDPEQLGDFFIKRSDIAFLRYTKGGVEYRSDGSELPPAHENSAVRELIKAGELAVSGVFVDRHGDDASTENDRSIKVFAVYVPVEGKEHIDGLVVFYYVEELQRRLTLELGEDDTAPVYFGVCSSDGSIAKNLLNGSFEIVEQENLFDVLHVLTNDESQVETLRRGMKENASVAVRLSGEEYVVSFDSPTLSGGRLCVAGIYRATDVYPDGYLLAGTISAIIAILAVILVALLIFTLVTRLREIKKIEDFENHDPVYGCLTYKGFSEEADWILSNNRIAKYAVVYTSIPHIDIISKMYGETEADNTVKYIVNVLEKAMLTDERFCMLDREKYVLLIHYNEIEDIYNRMTVLNVVLYNCPVTLGRRYNLKQSVGVSLVDKEKDTSLRKNLDAAIVAERSHDIFSVGNVRIHTERLHEMFLRQSEIESKMEASLEKGDFKLFFQPKYNITGDRIDSAEVLVRWLDTEHNRYYQPSEFLPLFEANGFIRELDRFMFTEVCKTIHGAIEAGSAPVPLSVNVSRVTALAPDFVESYVALKKQYDIPDRMLTLEFTDSFVFDNLDTLRNITAKLHVSGILCSIDNFGAGHSSLNVLKVLSMDELKLDRFFIKSGVSRERDDHLLSSVISLAKGLQMKVVQQGVEDMEELRRLEIAGCDVLQGYIYAKPLSAEEYRQFIEMGGRLTPNA